LICSELNDGQVAEARLACANFGFLAGEFLCATLNGLRAPAPKFLEAAGGVAYGCLARDGLLIAHICLKGADG
jgi:hypothetical protein